MEKLLTEVNLIFKEVLENDALQINTETSAQDIDNWDSLNHVMLIAAIENRFDISFELDEMIEFATIGDILNAIQSKVA